MHASYSYIYILLGLRLSFPGNGAKNACWYF